MFRKRLPKKTALRRVSCIFKYYKSRRLLRVIKKVKIYSINFSHTGDYYNIENENTREKTKLVII